MNVTNAIQVISSKEYIAQIVPSLFLIVCNATNNCRLSVVLSARKDTILFILQPVYLAMKSILSAIDVIHVVVFLVFLRTTLLLQDNAGDANS